VKAVGSLGPKLDDVWRNADRSPILGAGNSAIRLLGLQRFEARPQGVKVVDRLALSRDVGLELMATWSSCEQLLSQLAPGD
jgi:hypothetical protein